MKKTITSIIQFFLSIVFIYLTFSKIELDSLATILKESNLILFSLSPILYFISQIISSERLRNLLKVNGYKLSFKENGKLYLIGMFYNFFVPGGIGGDLYKTYLMKKFYSWKVKNTIKLIIQDRLIGLGVLFMLIIFLENGLVGEKFAADSIRTKEELSWLDWGSRFNIYLKELEKLFYPELFIIGGGVSKKPEKFIHALDIKTPIRMANLKNEAGIIGAAIAAKSKMKEWKKMND